MTKINITKEMQTAASSINAKRSIDTVKKPVSKPNMSEDAILQKRFQSFVRRTDSAVATAVTTRSGETIEKVYLKAEAWLFVISLFNLNVDVQMDMVGGNTAIANVKLKNRDGEIVSSGVMSASSDEDWLKDKPKYAVIGLAQTRAISRAVRNKYGWFVRLCGYETTPDDEMPQPVKKGTK